MCASAFLMGCWAENTRRLSSKGDTCTLKCSNQFSAARIYQQLNYHSQAESIFLGASYGMLSLLKLWVCICVAVPKQLLAPSLRTCGVKLQKLFFRLYISREVEASHQNKGSLCHMCRVRVHRCYAARVSVPGTTHKLSFVMSGAWGAET